MVEHLSPAELDSIAQTVRRTYEDYPLPENRLYLGKAGLYMSGATLIVPDGAWHVRDHPDRRNYLDYLERQGLDLSQLVDPDVPSDAYPVVPATLSEQWRQAGYTTDQYGRFVLPEWEDLLGDPRIGLPTGIGIFRRYGRNANAKAFVYRGSPMDMVEVLLVNPSGSDVWVLPSGFVDRDKDASPAAAAAREVGEETGLDQERLGTGEAVMEKPQFGIQTTLNACKLDTLVVFDGDQDYLFATEPTPDRDPDRRTAGARWFAYDQLRVLHMPNTHRRYIDLALGYLRDAA